MHDPDQLWLFPNDRPSPPSPAMQTTPSIAKMLDIAETIEQRELFAQEQRIAKLCRDKCE